MQQRHATFPLWLSASRLETCNDNGTGYVLDSAIAAGLAQRMNLVAPVGNSRDLVQQALVRSSGVWNGSSRLLHQVVRTDHRQSERITE